MPGTGEVESRCCNANSKHNEVAARPESIQSRVLKLLGSAGETGFTLEDLADILETSAPRLEPYLDALKEQAYVGVSYSVGNLSKYTIAPKGKRYLEESRLT